MTLSGLLSEIEARAERATEGPWLWYNGCSWWRLGVATNQMKHDAVLSPTIDRSDGHPNLNVSAENREFIATSRTDVPRLVKALRVALERIERSSYPDEIRTRIEAILKGEGE